VGKFYIFNLEAFNFRYDKSVRDPRLGGFGEILPGEIFWVVGQNSFVVSRIVRYLMKRFFPGFTKRRRSLSGVKLAFSSRSLYGQ
jgi:hypothetical protein